MLTLAFTDGSIRPWDDDEAKHIFWHSSAHLMAEALEALYPGVKFGVGPAVETGFYYDVDLGDRQISEADGKQLILLNSVCTVSTDECTEQIKTIRAIVNRYDPHAYITGESVLTDDLIEVTARDFRVTSIISIAAVAVLIAIFLKSGSLPFLLVASIELAIMINKGFAFLLGTEMAFISPTIIGCVQLGATVDYAILLSTRFREELHRGLDKKAALKKATDESDRSIFQSALVFFGATFAVYLTCDIEIIKGICALLALACVLPGARSAHLRKLYQQNVLPLAKRRPRSNQRRKQR